MKGSDVMYRSQSTSSVFIDALHQVSPGVNPGSNERDFNNVHNYRSPASELLYEPEMRSREPETRDGATMSTLTSALTGSKMATAVQLPTSAGTRPLPKALLPKAARTPSTPPVTFGGTVFAWTPPKPSDGRRSSFSYNTLPRHPGPAPGGWGETAFRPHSASVSSPGSRLSSSRSPASVKKEIPVADDSPFISTPLQGEKERVTPSGFQSSSVGQVTRPVVIRRREPIVEDSIYPLLKAALGKDRDAENRRTEEEIVRQVFGRSSRVFSTGASPASSSPAHPSTPVLLSPRNIYSSVDDVFASSSSEGMTSPPRRSGTLRHSHAKSSSEVIVSNRPNRLQEFLPSQQWRQIPAPMKGGNDPRRKSGGRDEDRTTRDPDYIASDWSVPTRPPPLPPSSPPPPPLDAVPAPDHRLYSRVLSCENLCRAPISAEPRKVIRNPRRNAPHPQNSPQPLHGTLPLPAESFPLLARVDRHLLDGESEFVDAGSSRTPSSKIQNTESVDLDPKRGERLHRTVPSKSTEDTPPPLLPPPLGFRDSTPTHTTTPSPPFRTSSSSTASNGAHFPIRHQATDSVNTEDSGLDRWEKEEDAYDDPPSADEMDAASDRTTTIAPGPGPGPVSSAGDERRGSSPPPRSSVDGSGGQWREDQSEGRGSLTSSPRPHSADYTTSPSSAKEGVSYSSPSTRQLDLIVGNDGRRVASNGILSQLLAENSASYRQTPHGNIYHRSDHHHNHHHRSLDDAEEAKGSGGGGEGFGTRSVRLPSSDLDGENGNCLSTTVQPSASDDTLERIAGEAADDSRKTDLQRHLETIEPWNRRSWFGESGKQRPEAPTGMKDGGPDGGGGGGGDMVVDIVKGPVGVGFCIEGGRGSLAGDRPILVKRLFKGGLTESLVDLRPGDELVSVGGQSLEGFSHYDAWKFIKALPNGTVQLTIRRA